MAALLAFSVLLVAAVLLSERFRRTVLSSAVLFLVGGFVLGKGGAGLVVVGSGTKGPQLVAELALFAILITDGTRLGLGVREQRPGPGNLQWRLPARALAFGMPLTIVLAAGAAHWLVDLPWIDALLLGAVLSPTDPVFSASLVGNTAVPLRLRRLLNVESGVNDGIALPAVLVFLSLALHDSPPLLSIGLELLGGVAVGFGVPYAVARLERLRWFARASRYDPLGPLAVTLVVYATARETGANLFLAAFACGIALACFDERGTRAFERIADPVSELFKLGAVFVFAALITPTYFDIGVGGVVFTVLMLIAVRPAAIFAALGWSGLTRREFTVAAWFGPRGFASIAYALFVLQSGVASGDVLYHLVAVVVISSIVIHSTLDVPVANWAATSESNGSRTTSGGSLPTVAGGKGVDLGADQRGQHADVEPQQHDDDGAGRAVASGQAREVGRVHREEPGPHEPEQ